MGLMTVPTIKAKYVNSFVDRYGQMRHYFRRNGKAIRLPDDIDSPEFADAWSAALNDRPATKPSKRPVAAQGTFAALATAYYFSPTYTKLSPASRTNYKRVIDHFLEEHGWKLVEDVRRDHIEKLIGAMADRPGAGIILLKRIRTLVRFAIKAKWVDIDPTSGVESFKSKEVHTWTEDELAQFEQRWPIGTKQRLAYALCLYTGQRGASDVRRMIWPTLASGVLVIRQKKTGAELTLALHSELKAILAVAKRDHITIITTEYGRPFSEKGFGQWMSDAIRSAGLPDRCKTHGLRKAAARRLAEAGCSANEIAAVTGHKTLAEVERYTRAADQKRLNQRAVARQEENEKPTNSKMGSTN